jgi:hypothetical protein
VKRLWGRDRRLVELEEELRARRSSPPRGFVQMLARRVQPETRWLAPRARIVLVTALAGGVLVAVASAGGLGVATSSTSDAIHVFDRLTGTASSPTIDASSPSNNQYKPGKGCGDPNHLHERKFQCKASINSISNKEGNTGVNPATPFTFTMSLSDTPLSVVTAAWTTADGTATVAGNDYLPAGGTVTFPVGVQTQTVTVYVVGDRVKETNETFAVNITSVSDNAYIGTGTGTGTILNDDK